MIKRIVKMTFVPDKVEEFKEIYRTNWKFISSFEGCAHVELLQADLHPDIFFTFSVWESEEHLNRYRHSQLFEKVWSSTKKLFNAKPEAWTVKEQQF